MTREQLEHIVRASGAITDENIILVLGSQSILGAFPDAPGSLCASREADVFPVNSPDKADLISGAIGEISVFDGTFGYYAHGLPPEACPLPVGWESRLISFRNENTRGVTARCLHPLDLAASKLAAGREKDIEFVAAMLAHSLIQRADLEMSVGLLPKEQDVNTARHKLVVVDTRLRAQTAREDS